MRPVAPSPACRHTTIRIETERPTQFIDLTSDLEAFVTASGIQYCQIAAAIVLSVTPTLLLALYAQRYLVEGLSLGAVKG